MNYMKIPAFYKVWLFTLPGLFSFSNAIAQCDASYVFSFVDDHTAVFFNNSENYNGQEWALEDGTRMDGPEVMTVTLESDTTTVCLRVWTDDGCEDVQCLSVYPGAPDEMCLVSDCVWPGDANDDLKANNYDVLSIGMGYGAAGPARPFFPDPENPIAWAANFSDDWSGSIGTVNNKHLDCDGNGLVDEGDLEAIDLNYQADFSYNSAAVDGAPVVRLEFQQDSLYYYNLLDQDTVEVKANIILGSEEASYENIYGIAFDILYPNTIVGENSTTLETVAESFLGDNEEVLTYGMDINSIGRFDLAISRTSGLDVGGHGNVGEISFIISTDIIGGLTEPQVPFELLLERLKVIDKDGNELDFELETENATLMIIRDIVAGEKANLDNQIQVYPNPVTDFLFIDLDKTEGEILEMYNILGQPVRRKAMKGSKERLNVSDIPPGIYLIRIETSDGILTKQIHVE